MSTMGLIAAVILSLYIVALGVVLLLPPKQHDPQRGMAVGCLMIVVLGLAVLLGLLIVGEVYHIAWLTQATFYVAVFPLVLLIGPGVMWVLKKAKGEL